LNPHTNFVAVGLFLIAGIISVMVLIMWLGKAGDATPREEYVVQIHGNVNGLSNGSAVYYLGVNVGSVVAIVLHTEDEPMVEVHIQIQKGLPITEQTYATLVTQGVTGIGNIDLANDPNLDAPQRLHQSGLRVIPFRASGLSAFLSGSGDLTVDMQRLLARLNAWAGEENRERVETILENIEVVTSTLAEERQSVPEVMGSLKDAMASLERTTARIETSVTTDWPAIAGDLKQTSGHLAAASARVDGWLAENEGSIEQLLGPGFEDASGLAAELHAVTEELTRLSARLREDPSRLIYRPRTDAVVTKP
jgi:phospholipid/cholesterol/gamma-HCH transport system substrate-binding protein